jgi:peptidoglycan L-alanyl-D-glutamate endopeptidase CwlK
MSFKLSNRSLKNLVGVHPDLVRVVKQAIILTPIDFAVTEGLRTIERQKMLVESGASRTMNSQHLVGRAVDLAAFVDGKVSWDLPLYCKLAQAMKAAANYCMVEIRWGGVWDKRMNEYTGSPAEEIEKYASRMLSIRRQALIDGPHFELAHEIKPL